MLGLFKSELYKRSWRQGLTGVSDWLLEVLFGEVVGEKLLPDCGICTVRFGLGLKKFWVEVEDGRSGN